MSGPSFLGLGDERSRDLDYLFEDDAPRSHGRLYLALLLLILSGGLLAWHWQRDGYPWKYLQQAVTSKAPASPASAPARETAAAGAPTVVPVEPTANPAPPETPAATGEAAQSGAGPAPAGSTPAAPNPAEQPAGGGGISDNPAQVAKPADQASQPDQNPGSAETAAQAANPASPSPEGETEPAPKATKTPKETRIAATAPMPKAPALKPSPTAPAMTFEDRLVADGEKYLYGRGVPEDCTRAQRNLQIAARESNAKAQTLLGAMYATGHCVGRDLPTAYRWFAKALHGDPGNSRVQRDLEVLWKQMTPEERLVAMKSQ